MTAMHELLARLNQASVARCYQAHADVEWEAPRMAIAHDVARCELAPDDPLARTDWYRSQSPHQRSRIGLHRAVAYMKTGADFENLLQRGLLVRAMRLRDGTPEFRYIHHEITEESQHSMMFQEAIDRTGLRVRGMPSWARLFIEVAVLPVSSRLPMLFFIGVLAGEDPIDHVQRAQLRGKTLHPLLERITQIHVTEEARHVSYARSALIDGVPRLSWARRRLLAVVAPLVVGMLTRMMLLPPPEMRRELAIPREVLREAYGSPQGRRFVSDSVRRTRTLCRELGLMTPGGRVAWRLARLWDADAPAVVTPG